MILFSVETEKITEEEKECRIDNDIYEPCLTFTTYGDYGTCAAIQPGTTTSKCPDDCKIFHYFHYQNQILLFELQQK